MEIPNIKKYDNPQEKFPEFDFLGEKLKVSITIEQEAFDNLPKITKRDILAGLEKYHVLLGSFSQKSKDEIVVHIDSVLEVPDDRDDKNLYYKEGTLEVVPNLKNIQSLVKSIQDEYDEFKDSEIVGDIHTHPVESENPDDMRRFYCNPSDDDIKAVIHEYENNILSRNKPFVFAIATRVDDSMEYFFYRLVKRDKDYFYERLLS